jgi:hypothetical protein
LSLPDFDSLRGGLKDCPSDLALDRLKAGELEGEEKLELETHLSACECCAQRLSLREAGFEAFPEVDPRRLLASTRRRADEPAGLGARVATWLQANLSTLAPLAAAGIAVAVLAVTVGPGADPPVVDPAAAPTVRSKGEAILHVHRALRGGGSEELQSGGAVAPGDRLRFVVDLPRAGHVAILGVEQSGKLYTAWPLKAEGGEKALPAGPSQALPGAVTLDKSPGREVLHLVLCPEATGRPQCSPAGAGKSPRCPKGCATSPFVLNEGP